MRFALTLTLTLPLPLPLACLPAALLMVSAPAAAADWVLIRWVGPQRCEVVSTRPRFGRWEELAVYPLRKKADFALAELQKRHLCRASPPKAAATPVPPAKPGGRPARSGQPPAG